MRNKLIATGWVLFGILALTNVALIWAQTRPRIVYEGYQKVYDNDSHTTWEFFHDNETHQEVVCVLTINAPSCYLTGRTW